MRAFPKAAPPPEPQSGGGFPCNPVARVAIRIQESRASIKGENRQDGKKRRLDQSRVPTFEQPCAAQKFSAQEFPEALRPVNEQRNVVADRAGCSKVSTSKSGRPSRGNGERSSTMPPTPSQVCPR